MPFAEWDSSTMDHLDDKPSQAGLFPDCFHIIGENGDSIEAKKAKKTLEIIGVH